MVMKIMNTVNLLATNHYFVITVLGILGLIIGSFLNVVIYRLPLILKHEYEQECLGYFKHSPLTKSRTFNLAIPRSYCPKCKTTILWWQNIPVISYIILQGKCSHCKKPISWHYPLVEILSCITTILVANHFNYDTRTWPMLILSWMLIAAIFIDLERQLLPDNITLPLVWLGLLLNTNHTFTSPQNAIIGAVSGYLFLWIIAKTFKLIKKVEGMGHGDFKLLAVFGAWLGWQLLPLIILMASLAGLLVGVSLILCKKHQFNKPLPFGPYIATAGWLAFFWGQTILNYTLRL
jgi:leader peptidase (prepilin peptidase) / N-methyltransferase